MADKTETLVLDLYHITEPVLIIKTPTPGVAYTNQVNGVSCSHPSQEGILMPWPEEYTAKPLFDPDYYYTHGFNTNAFKTALLELIETVENNRQEQAQAKGYQHTPTISNLEILEKEHNMEAWVHIRFTYQRSFPKEKRQLEAILTWENCD